MDQFTFSTIGLIHSCYKEKFGIPRQPGLVDEAIAELVLTAPYNDSNSFRELRQFSHLWLVFVFHQAMQSQWKPLVRPPRLGGNQKVGVFASRSPFRPNSIGLSAVSLEDIIIKGDDVRLLLRGCDLLDGTPIIDIKPYIPYSDSIPQASPGFASQAPEAAYRVRFSTQAKAQCDQQQHVFDTQNRSYKVSLKKLITQVLSLDPRPSYKQDTDDRIYAMRLYHFDLRWRYCENRQIEVVELVDSTT